MVINAVQHHLHATLVRSMDKADQRLFPANIETVGDAVNFIQNQI